MVVNDKHTGMDRREIRSNVTMPASISELATAEEEDEEDHVNHVNRQSVKRFGRFTSYDRLLRPIADTKAMTVWVRWWKRAINFFCCVRQKEETPSFQYRIPPREERQRTLSSWFSLVEDAFVFFTRFMNRANFLVVSLSCIVLYFVQIFFFAIFINLIVAAYVRNQGVDCLTGFSFQGDVMDGMIRSFDLSWTTYSTVGYGTVSVPADDTCMGFRYFLAFEAFLGILFANFCGGMFFLKTSRLHTRASATFSSCMCLQFGKGVSEGDLYFPHKLPQAAPTRRLSVRGLSHSYYDEEEDEDTNAVKPSSESIPFPVLVFRLINERASMGQIVGASINCSVVSIDTLDNDEVVAMDSDRVNFQDEQANEGVGSRKCSPLKKRTYCKLHITPEMNPHFANGVWYVRHIVNEKSALLKTSVRERIAEIGGWPSDIDCYSKIRNSMSDKIQGIIVTLDGTSNLTADHVFKTVTYKHEDIYIGYRFARMHYLSGEGTSRFEVGVDPALLHDIVPQEGGGSEPLGTTVCN